MDRSRRLLLDAASVAHFATADDARNRLNASIEAQNDARLLLTQSLEAQNESEKARRLEYVQNWLGATNCEEYHADLQELRKSFPDTTKWIYGNDIVHRWMYAEPVGCSMLWLSGILGAGK